MDRPARLRHPDAGAVRGAVAALDPRQRRRRLGRRQPPRAARLPLRPGHAADLRVPRRRTSPTRRSRTGSRACRPSWPPPRACGRFPWGGERALVRGGHRGLRARARPAPSASTRSRASATCGWSVDGDAARRVAPARPRCSRPGCRRAGTCPPEDVRLDVLTPSDTVTRCPYKGQARFWSAPGARRHRVVLPGADPGVPADRRADLRSSTSTST